MCNLMKLATDPDIVVRLDIGYFQTNLRVLFMVETSDALGYQATSLFWQIDSKTTVIRNKPHGVE